jgi:hypothetical protein
MCFKSIFGLFTEVVASIKINYRNSGGKKLYRIEINRYLFPLFLEFDF